MSAPAVKKPATYADIEALPANMVGQLIDGELFAMPRPAWGHAKATSTLGMDLGSAFQRGRGGPGGWLIVDEPELHLGHDVLVPDLAGWRLENVPAGWNASTPYVTLAPDWVCEVLSPSTASLDRVRKSRRYAREGISWSWLVDPVGKTLEAYKLDNGLWVQLGTWSGDETPRVAPFDAIELQLSALWLDDASP